MVALISSSNLLALSLPILPTLSSKITSNMMYQLMETSTLSIQKRLLYSRLFFSLQWSSWDDCKGTLIFQFPICQVRLDPRFQIYRELEDEGNPLIRLHRLGGIVSLGGSTLRFPWKSGPWFDRTEVVEMWYAINSCDHVWSKGVAFYRNIGCLLHRSV